MLINMLSATLCANDQNRVQRYKEILTYAREKGIFQRKMSKYHLDAIDEAERRRIESACKERTEADTAARTTEGTH